MTEETFAFVEARLVAAVQRKPTIQLGELGAVAVLAYHEWLRAHGKIIGDIGSFTEMTLEKAEGLAPQRHSPVVAGEPVQPESIRL